MNDLKTTIIFPTDKSTSFLKTIIKNLEDKNIEFDLLDVLPDQKAYDSVIEKLTIIDDDDLVIFLGHGSPDRIYGGESEGFEKKHLVKNSEMSIFKNKNLFLLACDSSSLLKSSFNIAKIKKSIGFGPLPTDLIELNSNKFKALGATEETIEEFKIQIINIISSCLIHFLLEKKNQMSMLDLKDYIVLLINKEINNSILTNKNRPLADLLFFMKTDLAVY